jgi:hypothetical protein
MCTKAIRPYGPYDWVLGWKVFRVSIDLGPFSPSQGTRIPVEEVIRVDEYTRGIRQGEVIGAGYFHTLATLADAHQWCYKYGWFTGKQGPHYYVAPCWAGPHPKVPAWSGYDEDPKDTPPMPMIILARFSALVDNRCLNNGVWPRVSWIRPKQPELLGHFWDTFRKGPPGTAKGSVNPENVRTEETVKLWK